MLLKLGSVVFPCLLLSGSDGCVDRVLNLAAGSSQLGPARTMSYISGDASLNFDDIFLMEVAKAIYQGRKRFAAILQQ